MRYVSTRGQAPALDFVQILMEGLARDGGLYVPEMWPSFSAADWQEMRDLSYPAILARVIAPYVGATSLADSVCRLAEETCREFAEPDIAPLRQIGDQDWLLELFHGPTLAFKDHALQLLGRLFSELLGKSGQRVTILGATSGDTGSAALAACRDQPGLEIIMLFPEGRISEIQRRQMTTVVSSNVRAVAVRGSFDDCQNLVKAAFNDVGLRDHYHLAAVNSINWARIAAQTAYYVYAWSRLGGDPVAFAVPSGNFGNVFAAYSAERMGLPIDRLIVGSNCNDVLTRFIRDNDLSSRPVVPTTSPSIDIQVPSNLERLLFYLLDQDGDRLAAIFAEYHGSGRFDVPGSAWDRLGGMFAAYRFDDAAVAATIQEIWQGEQILLDPHTAVGVGALREARRERRIAPGLSAIALATAHPGKFPEAVRAAIGQDFAMPERLTGLLSMPERFDQIEPNIDALRVCMAR